MVSRRRSEFGAGVLASAEADEKQTGHIRSHLIQYLILALVGSGFGTCGVLQLFTAQ